LIDKNCRQARRFAWSLEDAGYRILNQVDLNQVLVSFGDAKTNQRIIDEIQQDGTCWCGGTDWRGHSAMRISVSSSETTDEDVERSLDAIIRIARRFSPFTDKKR
jgi:threonine aldolase